MYQYRVAVPMSFTDEMENVLAGSANVSLEAVVPAPSDLSDPESPRHQSDATMAVILVYGPDLESITTLKSWVDHRRSEHVIDLRGEDPRGQFNFSFHSHSLEEIYEWAARVSPSPSVAEGTR